MRKILLASFLVAGTITMTSASDNVSTLIQTVVAFCCPETGPPQCPPDCGN